MTHAIRSFVSLHFIYKLEFSHRNPVFPAKKLSILSIQKRFQKSATFYSIFGIPKNMFYAADILLKLFGVASRRAQESKIVSKRIFSGSNVEIFSDSAFIQAFFSSTGSKRIPSDKGIYAR